MTVQVDEGVLVQVLLESAREYLRRNCESWRRDVKVNSIR